MMYGVIRRYELTDAEWESLSPFLPSAVTGGRPREDDRRVLNGIIWKIRSGVPWRDVPAEPDHVAKRDLRPRHHGQ